jgi:hypothetical protein
VLPDVAGAAAPLHEATVSVELGLLVAALKGRAVRQPTPARGTSAVSAATERSPSSREPFVPLTLRRDGARPVKIRGALIHRTEVQSGEGRGLLQVFATDWGSAVAQIAYVPPDGLPARPVFRVAEVGDAAELGDFIDREGPERCLAGCGTGGADAATRAACNLLRLPRALPGLARPEHLTPLSCEGTQR